MTCHIFACSVIAPAAKRNDQHPSQCRFSLDKVRPGRSVKKYLVNCRPVIEEAPRHDGKGHPFPQRKPLRSIRCAFRCAPVVAGGYLLTIACLFAAFLRARYFAAGAGSSFKGMLYFN
jgi:hypothetical protein